MLKLLSLVLAAVAAYSTAPMFAPDDGKSPAAASLEGALPAPVRGALLYEVERPSVPSAVSSAPKFSGDEDGGAGCGVSYSETTAVAVGDSFVCAEFDTEEELADFLANPENRQQMQTAWLQFLTAHLPCGVCWDLLPCEKSCWYLEGRFAARGKYDPITDTWLAYIECTVAAQIIVTCLPCVY